LDGGYDFRDTLYGGSGSDTFVRHKGRFGSDGDRFEDYHSLYDRVITNWHW
jgi:hypothetical protein